ncbi:MAG: Protein GrpE [Calditrichaeota bacterium]|nr:Protein GrpE [Calditrichota bacterium]
MGRKKQNELDVNSEKPASEPENAAGQAEPEAAPETAEQGAETVDTEAAVAELEQENERLRDQLLRARAEFENFRRRTNREFEEFATLANAGLIEELLPVLDDLKLLVENAEQKEDAAGLLDGARLIQQKFSELLKRRGLEEVAAEGEPFDPDRHEALMELPTEDAKPGTVVSVQQTGYRLGPKLLRPSRVIVAAEPERGGGE